MVGIDRISDKIFNSHGFVVAILFLAEENI